MNPWCSDLFRSFHRGRGRDFERLSARGMRQTAIQRTSACQVSRTVAAARSPSHPGFHIRAETPTMSPTSGKAITHKGGTCIRNLTIVPEDVQAVTCPALRGQTQLTYAVRTLRNPAQDRGKNASHCRQASSLTPFWLPRPVPGNPATLRSAYGPSVATGSVTPRQYPRPYSFLCSNPRFAS